MGIGREVAISYTISEDVALPFPQPFVWRATGGATAGSKAAENR